MKRKVLNLIKNISCFFREVVQPVCPCRREFCSRAGSRVFVPLQWIRCVLVNGTLQHVRGYTADGWRGVAQSAPQDHNAKHWDGSDSTFTPYASLAFSRAYLPHNSARPYLLRRWSSARRRAVQPCCHSAACPQQSLTATDGEVEDGAWLGMHLSH